MQSLLRIKFVSEQIASDIADKFNAIIPEFCKNNGKHASRDDVYVFTLSREREWQNNQKSILKILSTFSQILSYAENNGALIEVDLGIFLINYTENEFIEFDFSNELIQVFAKHNICFGLSIYSINWHPKLQQMKYPMCSHIRILGMNEIDIVEIVSRYRQLFPDFANNTDGCIIKDKNLSLLLSNENNWDNNHDEILRRIPVMTPILSDAIDKGAFVELTVSFDMREYQERNLTAFIFLNTFSKLLSEFSISLNVVIFIDDHNVPSPKTCSLNN
ncbi:MAG: hypothetical protein LBQ50_05065 [Planctomycetaceae bacterium]|nr:hypothetical protein [Planctomycetaceae bacterium]